MKHVFVVLVFFWSIYSGAQNTWASKPVDLLKYSIPSVFDKQREVIYGDDEAEIYFSLTPNFSVDQLFLTLSSSHPQSLLIKSEGKLLPVTSQYVFTQRDSISKIRFKVSRVRQFSMASILVKVEFEFPKQEIIDWVLKDRKKRYVIPEAREELIQRIKSMPELAEETIGIFLYRKRFLKQR